MEVTPNKQLDWLIDYYRKDHPGINDAAIYELMRKQCSEEIIEAMAQRIKHGMTDA